MAMEMLLNWGREFRVVHELERGGKRGRKEKKMILLVRRPCLLYLRPSIPALPADVLRSMRVDICPS